MPCHKGDFDAAALLAGRHTANLEDPLQQAQKYSQGHNVVSHEEGREAVHHLGQHLRHLMSAYLSHEGGKLHHRAARGEC